MSWLALHITGKDPRRIGHGRLPHDFGTGSFLFEIDMAAADAAGATLFAAGPAREGLGLALVLKPGGTLELSHVSGASAVRVSCGGAGPSAAGPLRVTYHWDVAAGQSRLTVEDPASGRITQRASGAALPVVLATLRAIFTPGGAAWRHPAVRWIAMGDHLHPVGPGPALAGDTRIATPDGDRALSDLRRGDLVLTADAGSQPVLWQGAVTVPAAGSYRPLRLGTPAPHGGGDLILAPQQRVVLSGPEVEYMLGTDEVLAEAAHLGAAPAEHAFDTIRWHGLLLPRHHLIFANGALTESLHIGSLARSPSLFATTLPGLSLRAVDAPVHGRPVRRELMAFEAGMLAQAHARLRAPRPAA